MTGAIEFLRKAKAICKSGISCKECRMQNFCLWRPEEITDEADLVRKVMEYRLEDEDEI